PLGLREASVFVAHALQHREVGAARKSLLAGIEDRALDGGIAGDLVDDRRHLGDHFRRQHVHRAPGGVPRHQSYPGGVGLKTEIGQIHVPISARCQTRSMIVAVPMPPPMHNVMRAAPLPVRSSSSSTVPRIIAPVAPSGWPIAMAPPLTLTLSAP